MTTFLVLLLLHILPIHGQVQSRKASENRGMSTQVSTIALGPSEVLYNDHTGMPMVFRSNDDPSNSINMAYDHKQRRTMKMRSFTYRGQHFVDTIFYVYGPGGLPIEVVHFGSMSNNNMLVTIHDTTNHLFGSAYGMTVSVNNNDTLILIRDHQESLKQVYDASNVVQETYTYLPFGDLESGNYDVGALDVRANRYLYTSQEYDVELGLHNFRARMYDARECLFLQPDPVHQYNSPYVYVGNDPISKVDFSGKIGFKPQAILGDLHPKAMKTSIRTPIPKYPTQQVHFR